jgi:hypothetical protein
MESHHELVGLLQKASLVYDCVFPFGLKGREFVQSFYAQTIRQVTATGARFLQAPNECRSLHSSDTLPNDDFTNLTLPVFSPSGATFQWKVSNQSRTQAS